MGERMDGWFVQKKIVCTYNRKVRPHLLKPFQSRGTATMATNLVIGRAIYTGMDPRHLGRWSWLILNPLNGSKNIILLVGFQPNHGNIFLMLAVAPALKPHQSGALNRVQLAPFHTNSSTHNSCWSLVLPFFLSTINSKKGSD